MASLLAALAALDRGSGSAAFSLLLTGVVLAFAVDPRATLTLRNFFVVYTTALFAVGVPLFGLSPVLYRDMVLYIVAFLIGYALSKLTLRAPAADPEPARRLGRAWQVPVRRLQVALVVLIAFQVLLLLSNVSRYGVGAFYGGQSLVDQLTSYGKANVLGGLLQVVHFLLKYGTLAVGVVYVQVCFAAGVKVRYRYLVVPLILLPVLSLARSDAMHGVAILLVIGALERRLSAAGGRRRETAGSGPALAVRTRAPVPRVALGIVAMLALVASVMIGGLRQSRLTQDPSDAPLLVRGLPLVQNEFSPIQAYSEIKENEERLGRTGGSTVVWPLLLKVVPRGLFPDKPINSGAYFMRVVRPDEFAQGYALPPTLFGDAFVNFGMVGSVLACLVVGLVAARLDVAYTEGRLSALPWFLIAFANFYALLRSPLSESLAGILLTTVVWLLLRRRLRGSLSAGSEDVSETGRPATPPVSAVPRGL
ncbi:MAG TPA: hypothetical protein VHG90_00775 [Acidimicrobiales bacterium]|nr:hypothetical protein [Acidimicrobiales bacterium]